MPGGMYKGQWDQGDPRDNYDFKVKIPTDYVSEPEYLEGVVMESDALKLAVRLAEKDVFVGKDRKMSSIKNIQLSVHQNAVKHGWWEGAVETPELILSKLALIHSEVSEALEDVRDGRMTTELNELSGKPDGFPTELADVVIRCMDLAEWLKIDLQKEIMQKHEYNLSRPYKHGRKV